MNINNPITKTTKIIINIPVGDIDAIALIVVL